MMRGNPTISVIIPVFGERYMAFLPEAVASVQAQTFHDWEIVIASGAPVVLPADAINVTVIDGASYDRGVYDARNRAIRASSGRLIVPLDADDKFVPTFMERTVAALPDTEHAIVGTDLQEFGLRDGLWRLPPYEGIFERNVLSVSSLFTRKLFDVAGGFDEGAMGFGDWDFWVRCFTRGLPQVNIIHEPLLRYRIHGANEAAMFCADPHHPLSELWTAALQLRHAAWYDSATLERATCIVKRMPEDIRQRIARRLELFPANPGLRLLAGLVAS